MLLYRYMKDIVFLNDFFFNMQLLQIHIYQLWMIFLKKSFLAIFLAFQCLFSAYNVLLLWYLYHNFCNIILISMILTDIGRKFYAASKSIYTCIPCRYQGASNVGLETEIYNSRIPTFILAPRGNNYMYYFQHFVH